MSPPAPSSLVEVGEASPDPALPPARIPRHVAPPPALRARPVTTAGGRALRLGLLLAARSNAFVAKGPLVPYHRLRRASVNREFVNVAATELLAREIAEQERPGAVAELGVYRGGYARILNEYFADRPLFLFDTFSGFDARDVEADVRAGLPGDPYAVPPATAEQVRARLPHPARATIRAGWFPDSAAGLEGESFCFVHVDVGLHHATAAGLTWFYPRLVAGGFLLVADYNNAHAPGVRHAVREFAAVTGAAYALLPDYRGSAVIVKAAGATRTPIQPA
jgi:O-methyltransferase